MKTELYQVINAETKVNCEAKKAKLVRKFQKNFNEYCALHCKQQDFGGWQAQFGISNNKEELQAKMDVLEKENEMVMVELLKCVNM